MLLRSGHWLGKGSLLVGGQSLGEVVKEVAEAPNLHLLTCGVTPPNPAELLGSNYMKDKIAKLISTALNEALPVAKISEMLEIPPEDKMGDVMTDLQGRRAIIMGMEAEGTFQKIKARVPLAEMNRYSTALSSITSGRAMYGMKYAEYSQVPGDIQDKLLKEYEESLEEE